MTVLDYVVLVAYAAMLLAIGAYYGARSKSDRDYLLGGRTIKWFNLGLSLFATMLSAVTYLAVPGEMIQYGPVFVIGKIASYPLVALLVGWFIIPLIMRLEVTSAYEILEQRLDLSVRILGSTFFLALRISWMAVVVYATAAKVIVPVLELPPSAVPWICGGLGVVTVAYTSLGGLRAVVLTDVIQSVILFGAALLTLGIISVELGGFGAWWPDAWPANWPEATWLFSADPDTKTLLAAFLATLVWYVATQGSDQMAVQRFLANRDAATARKTLITALVSSALTSALLTLVGLAVLAYFRARGAEISAKDADKLFPRFIAAGLPPGITGLVIAGLLAVAMSSLSSGVNSACSVIKVDFLDRFREKRADDSKAVRGSMLISLFVGTAVVLLSTLVGMVQGNLLEVAFKVCNLLTVPLFGLFFMAMFVKRPSVAATHISAVFGLAVIATISFSKSIFGTVHINFLWAMPIGLAVQIAVGTGLSLLVVTREGGGRRDIGAK